ncbi:uncharacterized protein RCO7_06284 [Rhynchosporium graminicola]|uniref:Uncharacterized protein n=1 Tax=Rhynchosporium graminicola TaxID=2792576 RepID=A0A1E1KW95_9HELO|nr:uncharacterized protein RCO7_06284 [Rhynchosporium commune]
MSVTHHRTSRSSQPKTPNFNSRINRHGQYDPSSFQHPEQHNQYTPPGSQPKTPIFNSRINRHGQYDPSSSSFIQPAQHNVYTPPSRQPKTPTFSSRINRHGHYNPSTSLPEQQHHLTPSEYMVLLFALGILVAVVSWLVWIMVEFCITFVNEKVDEMDIRKRFRDDRHRAEERTKKAGKAGVVLGKMGLGGLAEIGGRIFGRKEIEAKGERRRKHEEWRGLLDEGRERLERGGYGDFDERHGYGYHEGVMYPSNSGNIIRYADGTSESSGCVGPMHGHREECVGDCTLQTRRRSREDAVETV